MALPAGNDAARHQVLVVGGGTAGITTAARLRRAGVTDIAVIEPSDEHWYQPLWTLVGSGQASLEETRRPEQKMIPKGVRWIRAAATSVDPDAQTVTTDRGTFGYDYLVMATGLHLDWVGVPGLAESVGHGAVSSNYSPQYAPHTWDLIRNMHSGTAVFTQPAGPIKCGGAPQKIAYIAADYWRRRGVLDQIRVILALPGDSMFGIPSWRQTLEEVAARYGIEVRLSSELTELDGPSHKATITDNTTGVAEVIDFDMLHAVPPQRAPEWVASSALANPASPFGYIEVDKHTLQHTRYRNVFTLGDVADLPTSKTGAAVRKQAPVLVSNLVAEMRGASERKTYDGYSSCPFVTARDRMLLAEFDYDLNPSPSIPIIDTTKDRRDMWLLKRYGLPAMYWHGMVKGRI